jgi:hypothetical protein
LAFAASSPPRTHIRFRRQNAAKSGNSEEAMSAMIEQLNLIALVSSFVVAFLILTAIRTMPFVWGFAVLAKAAAMVLVLINYGLNGLTLFVAELVQMFGEQSLSAVIGAMGAVGIALIITFIQRGPKR